MAKQGLFTRVELKDSGSRKKAPKVSDLPPERLHKIGLRGVKSMNPRAVNPEMAATGARKPIVYVLGEAPGAEEDEKAEQFIGKSGRFLRRHLEPLLSKTRLNYCCRTRPPKNRTPEPYEIECFRPSVVEDIEKTKPDIIIAVGNVAHAWCIGESLGGISLWRGRRYPCWIGNHSVWVYPILHPAYVLRVRDQRKVVYGTEDNGVPGREIERVFTDDIQRIIDDVDSGLAEPRPEAPDDFYSGIETYMGGTQDLLEITEFLELLRKSNKPASIDIETTGLDPHKDGSKILSMAIGTDDRVVSFLWRHRAAKWKERDFAKLSASVKQFLTTGVSVAQNAAFELYWFIHEFGKEIIRKIRWHDTAVQSYVLDERVGGHNLNFLTALHFGFRSKSLIPVTYSELEKENPKRLLLYNGLDTKYEHLIHHVQWLEIKRLKLKGIYGEHLRRIPTTVAATDRGILVDLDRVVEIKEVLVEDIEEIKEEIAALPCVKKYEKLFGRFSPLSGADVVKMFRDVLGRREGLQKSGKWKADKTVLEKMKDEPLAAMILKLRQKDKIRSTYIEPFHPQNKSTLVYPDNRLHPKYKTCKTATGRLASEDPNGQNWPKRKNPWVREIIIAAKGSCLFAIDFGQIEARIIAAASKDEALCEALWKDFDIHMHWAEKIADAWPKTFKERGSDIKSFRSDIKNQWTFPAFYGANSRYIAQMLELPDHISDDLFREFWDEFSGVLAWQKGLRKFYQKNGYVECLTGRRRHAPLSDNMIINTPIQGSASDIVVDAMNRLSEAADDTEWEDAQPSLNIHDDLTGEIPLTEAEDYLDFIIETMLDCPYDWVNVPLTVEGEVGLDWYNMKDIGTFRSDQFEGFSGFTPEVRKHLGI